MESGVVYCLLIAEDELRVPSFYFRREVEQCRLYKQEKGPNNLKNSIYEYSIKW